MSSQTTVRDTLEAYRTTRYSRRFNDEAIYNFLSALDCPRALTVWIMYQYDHNVLVDLTIDPLAYNTAEGFRAAYVASCFLSKSDFLDLAVSKKQAALDKFHEYEELCLATNNRFRHLALDPLYQGVNASLFDIMERKISEVLGDFSGSEFVDQANWGPGVSVSLKGAAVSGYNKFHHERGITRDLYSLVSPWFSTAYPMWKEYASTGYHSVSEEFFQHQVGNQVVTVPKNSKTDRVIAVEPGFNIWFQKAIGNMIRRRLRREGIDLNSQERNQQLAERASKDGTLSTVDFSSASDSISCGLVQTLLERKSGRWLSLLSSCRSRYGMVGEELLTWKKFSAMGNGFTFELESLIFYAAAYAVCTYLKLDRKDISVFGDDVIIPVDAYPLYSSFSAFLGFRVNGKKSFSSGPFRESCGAHYYDGVDCKPIYLKKKVSNVESVFKLANAVRIYAHRLRSHDGCDRSLLRTWRHLHRGLPRPCRLGIPHGFGDGGLIMNFDEATPASSRNVIRLPKTADRGRTRGYEGYHFPMFTFDGVTRSSDHPALLMSRLWVRSTERAYNNDYTLRGTVRLQLTLKVLTPQWYNLGPWI